MIFNNEECSSLISVRNVPYPYKSMLSICSDLDETRDAENYFELIRLLNAPETDPRGGFGLEFANSLYFNMPEGEFSYWNASERHRRKIRGLIRAGNIDCIHSWGDLATSRGDATKALEELEKHNCYMRVWVDHATAISNFGSDIMRGQGDVPGSPVYHADITFDYGIRYVWTGRVSSVMGQDAPRSIFRIIDRNNLWASFKTFAKEYAKGMLAVFGNRKYQMHRPNRLMRERSLRDGQKVFEFMRSNPHYGGVSAGDRGDRIGEVLTKQNLDNLVGQEGVVALYSHLGKVNGTDDVLPATSIEGLRLLANYQRSGAILVCTTSRLLNYCEMRSNVVWTIEGEYPTLTIRVSSDPEISVQGLCFEIVDIEFDQVEVIVNNKIVDSKSFRDASSKKTCVSIPWNRLNKFESDGQVSNG